MYKHHYYFSLLVITLIIFLGLGFSIWHSQNEKAASITDFQSCAAAGNPVQESYPERCTTSKGQTYTNATADPLITNPAANPTSSPTGTPITITGQIVCLTLKNPGEVQLLDCRYGIKDSSNTYELGLESQDKWLTAQVGTSYTVTGTLDTKSAGSSYYAVAGTINVTSLIQ